MNALIRTRKRLLAFAVAAAGMAVAAVAMAQPVRVTVVMKSGEKHEGQHLQFRADRNEFSLRKSLHDQLRVNPNQVAYVDFGGTPDVQVSQSGSEDAVVLKNGTVIKGQLIEMGHSSYEEQETPFFVILRDQQGQERRIAAAEVGRVYLEGGAAAAAATSGKQAQAPEGTIVVPGNQQWTPTGMIVRKGETISLNTTGQIQLSQDANDVAAPAGSTIQRRAPSSPLPGQLAGALIGRIGPNGRPFGIGNQTSIVMPESGELFLGVNDDHVGDNTGEFRVVMQRGRGAVPRRR